MACDGSSGCGCTCLCWCEEPRSYYASGIYEAPRPIPDALAFQPLPPVGSGGDPPAYQPVHPYVDGGGLGPPGAPAGPSIIDWGPKRPPGPWPPLGGGRKTRSRVSGWDDDVFLSPPPLEALKHQKPGPVLYSPLAKVRGPGEESRPEEAGSLVATWSIGDSSGAIQTPGGFPVTPSTVRPPDPFLGVQEPTPYSRAALAPPQAGEFLQGAGLGPGAGIGSEGSDPFEDNGRSAPMDTTVAEDAFPATGEPEEAFPMEPGDPSAAVAREPLAPPAFPGHPMAGQAMPADHLRRQQERSPFGGMPPDVGGSWRPHAGSRPSVRPGVGFSHGRSNPSFSAAVDARMKQLDAERRRQEAAEDYQTAKKAKDPVGMQRADSRGMLAKVDRDLADAKANDALGAAEAESKGVTSLGKRVAEEAERRQEREERKLVKMSYGSGDVAAARTAAANYKAAAEMADKATRLLGAASSARQDDRVRTADSREQAARDDVREAQARLAVAEGMKSTPDILAAKERIENAKEALKKQEATTQRTRKEAASPKARQEFKKRKVEAKKAAKDARQAAQDSRKAARREKNAARYGPAEALRRAQEDAKRARAEAEAKLSEAERTNRLLTDPDEALMPPAASGAGPDAEPKTIDCTCNPPCPASMECMCQCLVGTGEGVEGEGGIKGKHALHAQPIAPPDSGMGQRSVNSALASRDNINVANGGGQGQVVLGDDDLSASQPPPRVAEESPPKRKKKPKGGMRGPKWSPMTSLRTTLPQYPDLPSIDGGGIPPLEPPPIGERPAIPQLPEFIPLGFPKEDYHSSLQSDPAEVDGPISLSDITMGDLKERAIREWWGRKGIRIPKGAPVPHPPNGTSIYFSFETLSFAVETPHGKEVVGDFPSDFLPDDSRVTFEGSTKYKSSVISTEWTGDKNLRELWSDLVVIEWEHEDNRNVTVHYVWKFATVRTKQPFTDAQIAQGKTSRFDRTPALGATPRVSSGHSGSSGGHPEREWSGPEMGSASWVYDWFHRIAVYKGEESIFWKHSNSATKKEITDYLIDKTLEDNRWRPKDDSGREGSTEGGRPQRRRSGSSSGDERP